MPYSPEQRRAARAAGNDLTQLLTEKRTAAFWARVDIKGPDECWPWLGSKTDGGYGTCNYGPLGTTAHRVAYLLQGNILTDEQQVLHSCDNPPCMNPAHLFAGTQVENLEDMRRKGRAPDYRNFGEHNGRSRFTDKEVKAIRIAHEHGSSQTELARAFDVSITSINRIVHGKSHKHETPQTREDNPALEPLVDTFPTPEYVYEMARVWADAGSRKWADMDGKEHQSALRHMRRMLKLAGSKEMFLRLCEDIVKTAVAKRLPYAIREVGGEDRNFAPTPADVEGVVPEENFAPSAHRILRGESR